MKLLQSHKNRIFDEIMKAGLDPSDFEIIPQQARARRYSREPDGYCIRHRSSGSEMVLYSDRVKYTPAAVDGEEVVHVVRMDRCLNIVPIWLGALARELNEPDKFDEWEKARAGYIAESANERDKEPLNIDEKTRVISGLHQLREQLLKVEALPETHAQIEYLLGAAVQEVNRSSSRIALRYFLLGLVVQIVTLFGQNPAVRKACEELLNQFIAHVPFLLISPSFPG